MRGGFQATLIALLASAPAILQAVRAAEYFEGDGTVYTLLDPNNGNCNFMAYPRDAVTKYAALNTKQWDATKNCGRCAEVTCTDALCSSKTKSSEIVHIVDQCPGCESGDLDLAPDVFTAITGMKSDRLKIRWKFVDCPVTSKIKYCLKKGSNPFWAAVQPTNFASGIASVTVNGQETTMVDSAYYFLLDGKSEKQADLSKVTIALVSVDGQKVEDTVSFAAADCVEGKSQFVVTGSSSGQDQQQQPPASPATSAPSPAPVQQSQPIATTPAPSPAVVTAPVSTPAPAPATTTATTHESSPSSAPVSQVLATLSSSSSAVEVSGEADRAAVDDSMGQQESGLVATTSSPTTTPSQSSAPASDSTRSSPASPPSSPSSNTNGGNASRANTENSGGSHKTSPAVIVLSAFGCVAAVVLIALAAYVNKKKLDDKRADRREAGNGSSSGSLSEFAVVSINTTNGSFCQVTTPGGRSSSGALQFAVL
ncbi:hypothetical protein Gpo141_00003883 [Globisporangium polare]